MKTHINNIKVKIQSHRHSDDLPEDIPVLVRDRLRFVSMAAPSSATRAYLRRLRAAEMAAWELTGGDFLLQRCAPRMNLLRS